MITSHFLATLFLTSVFAQTAMPQIDAALIGHENIINCDANTPEVNLESETIYPGSEIKGAFRDIPHDNQDGVQSCYANTAKNLLIALSDGKEQASFLDIALQYRANMSNGKEVDIDAGNACGALTVLKTTGYCPQSLSPFENGNQNPIANHLLKSGSDLASQSEILSRLRDFFQARNRGRKIDPEFDAMANKIYQELITHPEVKFPLPIMRFNLTDTDAIDVAWKNSHHLAQPPATLSTAMSADFNSMYREFQTTYVSLIASGKNPDQIYDGFLQFAKPFLQKYGIASTALEPSRRSWKYNIKDDTSSPHYAEDLRASLDFIKNLDASGPALIANSGACSNTLRAAFPFGKELATLITVLKKNHIDPTALAVDGKLASTEQILSLATTPGCLNPENRKPVTTKFSCESNDNLIKKARNTAGNNDAKTKVFRSGILESLLRGLPVGHTKKIPGNTNLFHINTIVGLHFSPTLNRCEYLIRESQTGKSEWHEEQEVFGDSVDLSIVRKTP